MKEQVQETGIRRWFGDDFINMQLELAEAIRSIISDYGNCIMKGCNVTDNGNGTYNVSAGIAFLRDSNGANGKYCRVYAQTNVPAANFPLYIVQATRDRTSVPEYGREYKDATTKNIIVEHYGNVLTAEPEHSNYLTLTSAGVVTRFRDVIQSASYRFVTDAEKTAWNAKLDPATLTGVYLLARLIDADGTGSGLDADLLDGKHASEFVTTATYTAADVLSKLLTLPNPIPGLDADKLDGKHASEFALAGQTGNAENADTLDGYHATAFVFASAYTAADVLAKLLTVDGAGSGLDADLLDGNHASAFVTVAGLLAAILSIDGSGSGIDADKLDGNEATAFATAAQGTKADNAQPAADCVSANTANKAVKRDASGNFAAGTITVTDIVIA